MGFPALPPTFWSQSVFAEVPGKKVECHGSAWPIDPPHADVRLKMCVEINENDFRVVHHELGHIYYFLAYAGLPHVLQDGANAGFHEALGDTLQLSITPSYLRQIGLAPKTASDDSSDLSYLMRVALEKIPALATAVVVDMWRWKVYSGEVSPEHYNQAWWDQVRKYQGFSPPIPRTEQDFDAGMFYHVSYGVPYDRYFTAGLLEFDFYRALCKAAGHTGELHRCSFYGSTAAGDRLRKAMQLGRSLPWPDVLRELTGSRKIDGSALVEYLAPVQEWLTKQNEGRKCGWGD
jgi:peptidyl-dipeptidase A